MARKGSRSNGADTTCSGHDYDGWVRRWNVELEEPKAGWHYPRDLDQFMDWFSTESAARDYFHSVRFRAGMACPRCGDLDVSKGADKRWWCPSCRRRFTVTTGTVLEHTRIPLRTWLLVAWFLTQTKVGISALSIERIIGVHYQSAWSLLHKMRAAMDQGPRSRLRGDVEIDETLVGGVDPGKPGRAKGKKEVVVIAAEHVSDSSMGRIRMARLPVASGFALADFIEANVEPGSILLTDDFRSYPTAVNELAARRLEYTLKPFNIHASKEPAHEALPHVHRVASLFKRWGLGTHQGAMEGPHLDAYLDEFVFRFNRRHSENRGLLFWRLICDLVATEPLTRAKLGQRRGELAAADEAHSERLRLWDNAKQRQRYQKKAGREVRPYRRRAGGEDLSSTG